jgi:S1-C subfamily serine protease
MTVFLGRTEAQDSSLRHRCPRQPRPSSSTSAQRVARSILLLAVLFILVFDSSRAQTKSKSAASLIYERCHSSVVVVYPLDKDNKPLGQGSGFIIATNRVVTNHHVLADAAGAAVSFADGGTEVAEGIVADNPTRDIAIISVKTGTRAALKLGDELSLKQGDEVYAIGAPRGLDLSITNGIVSGFRSIEDQFLLQTTAVIAPGSSGGPLFDRDGGVIGVTTLLLTDSPGIYFSVGIGDVTRITRSASTIVSPISSLSGGGKVNQNAAKPDQSAPKHLATVNPDPMGWAVSEATEMRNTKRLPGWANYICYEDNKNMVPSTFFLLAYQPYEDLSDITKDAIKLGYTRSVTFQEYIATTPADIQPINIPASPEESAAAAQHLRNGARTIGGEIFTLFLEGNISNLNAVALAKAERRDLAANDERTLALIDGPGGTQYKSFLQSNPTFWKYTLYVQKYLNAGIFSHAVVDTEGHLLFDTKGTDVFETPDKAPLLKYQLTLSNTSSGLRFVYTSSAGDTRSFPVSGACSLLEP